MSQSHKEAAAGAGVTVTLGEPITSEFERKRLSEGRLWAQGYTQSELDVAQARYGLVFPPDLIALLRDRRPVLAYDWRSDDEEIRAMLKRPLEGLLFDVENNALWWSEWGERPGTPEARAEVVAKVVNEAPKLIPLVSHRYLPMEPSEAGNPVFSVHQSDVIYYGGDLTNYFEREFVNPRRPLPQHIKHIRFWSDLVERNR
ncbi:SMI1/KNR4 family protein [Phenylobacterium sp.]|uniref:SMI1/KNR4 family protein n=1 Tax=Phenylobacterium sp. TaxID=1871053 RepID=UPI00272F6E43|nr:SMI1/KNR4 family protein [Phenylobacterium sp.]MDP2212734.1 SMI1/KNR4 family protein [Phenylobacterium sp.]